MTPTIPVLHLSVSEWEYVSNTVNALKPAKIATKCLQSDQLTAGVWLKCSLDTEKVASPFARKVSQCLKARQSTLFDNDAFVAALFRYPRYRLLLIECQTEKAKNTPAPYMGGNTEPRTTQCSQQRHSRVHNSLPYSDSDIIRRPNRALLMEKERDTSTTQRRPHVSIMSLLKERSLSKVY